MFDQLFHRRSFSFGDYYGHAAIITAKLTEMAPPGPRSLPMQASKAAHILHPDAFRPDAAAMAYFSTLP